MDKANEILKEKDFLEEKLSDLRYEYSQIATPCQNTKCGFWRDNHDNHCSWTWWVTECKDYIDEES